MTSTPSLLRVRHPHGHHRVTFLELFYDLVFVFAVTQLSHFLMAHFTLRGAFEAVVLLLAVWWTWICTSWVANWLDPQRIPVRLCLLALMVAGLVFSASLPEAFAERALPFAGAYALMEVGRTLFFVVAVRNAEGLRRNFQRILAWFALGAACWLVGACQHGQARLAWWAAGMAVAYGSALLGFWTPGLGRSTTHDWNVEGGHLAERCGLFIIIALGESVLVTGATFAELAWTPPIVLGFALSLLGSMAMWWLYFGVHAEQASERFAASADPGRMARSAYTYMHLLLVAGIILSAVADEFVLAHPTGHGGTAVAIATFGSAALYLTGLACFRWAVWCRLPKSPLLGVAVLAALAPFAGHFTPLTLLGLASAVLVVVAMWEAHLRHDCPADAIPTPEVHP